MSNFFYYVLMGFGVSFCAICLVMFFILCYGVVRLLINRKMSEIFFTSDLHFCHNNEIDMLLIKPEDTYPYGGII